MDILNILYIIGKNINKTQFIKYRLNYKNIY